MNRKVSLTEKLNLLWMFPVNVSPSYPKNIKRHYGLKSRYRYCFWKRKRIFCGLGFLGFHCWPHWTRLGSKKNHDREIRSWANSWQK